jgi:hypothetical protein
MPIRLNEWVGAMEPTGGSNRILGFQICWRPYADIHLRVISIFASPMS